MSRQRVQLYRIKRVADRTVEYETDSLAGPISAANALHEFLKELPVEHVAVAYLNTQMQLTGIEEVSIGSVEAAAIKPCDVFRGAILAGARFILLAHNHPSGNAEPSDADTQLTQTVIDVGQLLGINLIDHLIITPGSITSLKHGTIITKTSTPAIDDESMFDVGDKDNK